MSSFSLGELVIGETFDISGFFIGPDIFHNYAFSTPTYESDNGEVIFDIGVSLSNNASGPFTTRLGRDNPIELIGDSFFPDNFPFFTPFPLLGNSFAFDFNIAPNRFIPNANFFDSNSYLQSGEDYRIFISDPFLDFYEVQATLFSGVIGEITTDDDFYCCTDGNRFYYDDFTTDLLGQEVRVGVGDLFEGQQITVTVASNEFRPVLMIFDTDTGEVIEASTQGLGGLNSISVNGENYSSAGITLELKAGITYGVSVETLFVGDTGTYLISTTF